MLLKVGDLAKRCGLTVRALHHYGAIGLLTPSARSESGYRLYDRSDIAKLHRIQALRRFGLSLADIGAILDKPDLHLSSIVDRQMHMLTRQIEQATLLHQRLARLQAQLLRGEEPELADWLNTLELMTMYDKYFSPEELKQLPFYQADPARTAEWSALVDAVRAAMASGLPAGSAEAQALGKRWMEMLIRDTNADPRLAAKLNAMHDNEPALQARTGITPELLAYIKQAFSETKLAIYAKYLAPEEFRHLRANYGKRAHEWPGLLSEVRQQMEQGVAPDGPPMRRLALRWLELSRAYSGDDPAIQAKIRAAHENEPELLSGTFADQQLLTFVRQAIALLPAP